MLASYLHAPVIDATALDGAYRATLNFSIADPNSLAVAVQQLGLKLERRKMHIAVLVVDHVERAPSAN